MSWVYWGGSIGGQPTVYPRQTAGLNCMHMEKYCRPIETHLIMLILVLLLLLILILMLMMILILMMMMMILSVAGMRWYRHSCCVLLWAWMTV